MAQSTQSKISYEEHASDSSYLCDLVKTAKVAMEEATSLFAPSSSPLSDTPRSLYLPRFVNTHWDAPGRPRAYTASLNQNCRNLAKHVKKPTHFPITPPESTLRRAREEDQARRNKINSRRRAARRNKLQQLHIKNEQPK
ncbi:hypothetical protein CC86DRAFT_388479 [Ophiobolus disseminans]|uniref:Uncharacterized protein n=1 Tax=Ophiobolus disseminans TaxID=1469910 RepID=A0A6A6ZD57_9PLEO|nr:hypothetical protein CC86DRAFT_388479 [Ophiobolus disseminans]